MDALKQIGSLMLDGALAALFLFGACVVVLIGAAVLLALILHPIAIPFVLVGLIGLYGLGVLANKILS